MKESWYVLHSKPHKEQFLVEQLQRNGFEVYCPLVRVKVVNPRARRLRPFFPSYIFIHIDLARASVSSLQWMPGTTGFVSFDGTPAPVPDGLIPAIRAHVDVVNAVGEETPLEMQCGDSVRVTEGPFTGYEAIFDARLKGSERVRVLLSLLQGRRQVPVELSASSIQKKGKR